MADTRISGEAVITPDGSEYVPLVQVGSPVAAGSFTPGVAYVILSIGSTDFTAIGAASNTVGLGFVATGAGSGSGTAGATSNKRARSSTLSDRGLYSGLVTSVPTDASIGFTNWYSQGSATLTDGPTGPYITLPPGTGQKATGRYKAAPGTPYSIRALVALTSGPGDGGNNPGMGIGWTDGTATQVISIIQVNAAAVAMFVASRATDTTAQTAQFTDTTFYKPLLIWLKIADDGTNVSFGWGVDGVNFRTVYTVAKASGALGGSGYTNVGVFVLGAANNDGLNKSATVFAWLTGA
jgi:hypothetical protein